MKTLTIDTAKWDDETKEAFARAFWDISGIDRRADADTAAPWAMPWHWCGRITVNSESVEEQAADFWHQCRKEYEESCMITVFHPDTDGRFSIARESQRDWCLRHGLARFDQRSSSGTAADGDTYFLKDEDAVAFLESNKNRWEDYRGDSGGFSADEIIRDLV